MNHLDVEPGIVVFTGPMFSEKTSELMRHLNRYRIAKVKTIAFRPLRDDRVDRSIVDAVHVRHTIDMFQYITESIRVVAIDEAQFFTHGLVESVQQLALQQGKLVIIACLDLDFRGQPFGKIPDLLAVATRVEKHTAICMKCGRAASRSQRIVKSDETVVVGGAESYEARCLTCWEAPADATGKQEHASSSIELVAAAISDQT
jgi:thymidine kinase